MNQKETNTFDWKEIKQQLDTVQKTINQEFITTSEKKKEILKARAKTLAREPEKKKAIESCLEVVEFILAGERYGIETEYVRKVYPMKELTPLPCTPTYVLGVTNVHGQTISVIDIKKFIGLPETGITDLNRLIIIYTDTPVLREIDGMEFGILADVILGAKSLPLNGIQPLPPTLTGIKEDYIKGITDNRVLILDAERLLTDKNIIVHEEIKT